MTTTGATAGFRQTQVQQDGPRVTLLTPPESAVLVLMLVAVAFWAFVSVVAPESRSADPPRESLPSAAGVVWHC
jgi:hypothetical protein